MGNFVNSLSNGHLNIDLCVNSELWLADDLGDLNFSTIQQQILHLSEFIVECLQLSNFSTQIELCVILTNDISIQQLNKQYRAKDQATNVLSFPSLEKNDLDHNRKADILILGDVFISFETLCREAAQQKKRFMDHFLHLLCHGILHLLGFDHETDQEAEQMENLEIAILSHFGVESPY